MDLLQWAPVVFKADNRPSEAVAMLEIRAWLRCLFCGTVSEVKSAAAPLNHVRSTAPGAERKLVPVGETGTYLDRPESRFHAACVQIKQYRACEHCGFVSMLPAKQALEFEKEMAKVITLEWILANTATAAPVQPRLRKDLADILARTVGETLATMDLTAQLENLQRETLQTIVEEIVAKTRS